MKRQIIKRAVDLAMTVFLLLLMAYHITGKAMHQWIGASMLILFIAHNLLNRSWYAALFKGRYSPYRILLTAVNLLVFLSSLRAEKFQSEDMGSESAVHSLFS